MAVPGTAFLARSAARTHFINYITARIFCFCNRYSLMPVTTSGNYLSFKSGYIKNYRLDSFFFDVIAKCLSLQVATTFSLRPGYIKNYRIDSFFFDVIAKFLSLQVAKTFSLALAISRTVDSILFFRCDSQMSVTTSGNYLSF